jgi:N,N-dimethylformamidase
MHRLTGYTNRWSVRAGGKIRFHVGSSGDLPFRLSFKRIHCADPNPNGPGYRATAMPTPIDGTQPGFARGAFPGSRAVATVEIPAGPLTLSVIAFPTTPGRGAQTLMHVALPGLAVALGMDAAGRAIASAGDARVIGPVLAPRAWATMRLVLDGGTLALHVGDSTASVASPKNPGGTARVTLAAGPAPGQAHYNGKLEAPALHGRDLIAAWDFSANIPTQTVPDMGAQAAQARLVNLPTRAVTSSRWDGSVHDWRVDASHYNAIHFHDDDIGDLGWPESFVLDVPADWPSGLYAAELARDDAAEDMIPFFVRPAKGARTHDVAVLFPTYSYQVYSCFVRPGRGAEISARAKAWGALQETPDMNPQFGLSTYNHHSDGSGVAITSKLRPQLDTRPRQFSLMDPNPEGSGTGRIGCDSYILEWLDRLGIDCDVVTDHDLHEEGAAALTPYRVIIATQHPEYHSWRMLDGIEGFLRAGGRFIYLGGNGFYWRCEPSLDAPHALEVRRAEGGIRVWEAHPGEYHHAFGGGLGGLWRRVGRPAHALVGNGFSCQGKHLGFPFAFTEAIGDPRLAFIRDGINVAPGEKFGDRGYMGGGAAGFELDSFDVLRGSPPHGIVLAKGICIHDDFCPVNEDMLVHRHPKKREDWACADMVFFETPAGGAVFSVGSMTYVGSLLIDGGNNTLAKLTANVVRRFRDPAPFSMP